MVRVAHCSKIIWIESNGLLRSATQ